jgi:hypothetical protein
MNDLSTTISTLLSRVEAGEVTNDDALMFWNNVEAFKRAAAELGKRAEAALISYIDKRGELTDGERRWYVGAEKKTTVLDKAEALRDLCRRCGGDVGQMAEYLGSEPFKHGACKTLGMDEHFVTETKKDLKDAPVRKVKATQGAF